MKSEPAETLARLLLCLAKRSYLKRPCAVCDDLSSKAAIQSFSLGLERRFGRGDMIVSQGEPCDGIFVLTEGKARLFKSSETGIVREIGFLGASMTIGESALFCRAGHLESAVAVTPVSALWFPRAEVLQLLKMNSEMAFQMMSLLSQRVCDLTTSIDSFAFKPAIERVAGYFLSLANVRSGKALVTLPEKKKDIAAALGIAPETLSRAIRKLEETGEIQVNRRTVQIRSIEKLCELAQR